MSNWCVLEVLFVLIWVVDMHVEVRRDASRTEFVS